MTEVASQDFTAAADGTVLNEGTLIVNALGDINDGDAENGVTTLREAIELANTVVGENTITFDLPDESTIALTSTLNVTDDLLVDASSVLGLTVAGNGFNLIDVESANLEVNGLAFSGGNDALNLQGEGSTLSLTDVEISDSADNGIGVIGASDSSLSLNNVIISGAGDNGIQVLNSTNATIELLGTTIAESNNDGINAVSDNVTVVANFSDNGFTRIQTSGDDGIDITGTSPSIDLLLSTEITDSGDANIEIEGGTGGGISLNVGARILRAGNDGIDIDNSDDFTVLVIDAGVGSSGDDNIDVSNSANVSINLPSGSGLLDAGDDNFVARDSDDLNLNFFATQITGAGGDGIDVAGGSVTFGAVASAIIDNAGENINLSEATEASSVIGGTAFALNVTGSDVDDLFIDILSAQSLIFEANPGNDTVEGFIPESTLLDVSALGIAENDFETALGLSGETVSFNVPGGGSATFVGVDVTALTEANFIFAPETSDDMDLGEIADGDTTFLSEDNLVVNALGDINDGDAENGVTTLREAIEFANAGAGKGTISFDLPDESTIALTSTLNVIDDLLIDASSVLGLTIAGNGFNLIDVESANLEVNGLAFSGGNDALNLQGEGSTLSLTDVEISDSADDGIGVSGASNSSLFLDNATIDGAGDEGIEVRSSAGATIEIANGSSIVGANGDGVDVISADVMVDISGGSSILASGDDGIDVAGSGAVVNITESEVSDNGDNNVEFDGVGGSLDFLDASINGAGSDGIDINNSAGVALTIFGGSVDGSGDDNIDISGSAGAFVTTDQTNIIGAGDSGIQVRSSAGATFEIDGTSIFESGGDGIDIASEDVTLSSDFAVIAASGGDGISVTGANADVNIISTGILDSADDGVDVAGNGASLNFFDSEVSDSIDNNIEFDGVGGSIDLVDTTIANAGSDGLDISNSAGVAVSLFESLVENSGDDNIDLANSADADITLETTFVSGAGDNGIQVVNSTNARIELLEATLISDSNNDGINAIGENVTVVTEFADIEASGDDGIDITGTSPSITLFSTGVVNSGDSGIEIEGGTGGGISLVTGGNVFGSGNDGIDIDNSDDFNVFVIDSGVGNSGDDNFDLSNSDNAFINIVSGGFVLAGDDNFVARNSDGLDLGFSLGESTGAGGDGIDVAGGSVDLFLFETNIADNAGEDINLSEATETSVLIQAFGSQEFGSEDVVPSSDVDDTIEINGRVTRLIFDVGPGNDTVEGFIPESTLLDVSALGIAESDFETGLGLSGETVSFNVPGGGSATFVGVDVTALTEANFIFA